MREIKYFNYLKNFKDISFFPKFYGAFETEDLIGYEQECFLEIPKGGIYKSVLPIWAYIGQFPERMQIIKRDLSNLRNQIIESGVVLNDLHEGNILRIEQSSSYKLVIIDGYGQTEWIPICQYFDFFRKRKIDRQWEKFISRMKSKYPIFNQE